MSDDTLKTYNGHPLRAFLNERYATTSAEACITSMRKDFTGKWFISDKDYPQFLDLLHDYLFVKNGTPLTLVEQPRLNEAKPLLIDLDFKYSKNKSLTRTFTEEHIQTFVESVVRCLTHFFDVSGYEAIRFFVTLRPSPYSDKNTHKDGIHIESPDVCLTNKKQAVIRSWLLQHSCVTDAFAETEYTNDVEDIYDVAMTRKQGWFLYGESKPNIPRYELNHVISYNPSTEQFSRIEPSKFTKRGLMEILSVRYNLEPDENKVRQECVSQFNAISSPAHVPAPEPVVAAPVAEMPTIYQQLLPVVEQSEEDRRIITGLVMDCLSPNRADKYEEWIRVGWCLHNIEPSEDNFKLWMDFSRKSPKFADNNVASLRRDWFGRMRKDGDGPRLTELALRKWARDDNPEAYKNIIDKNILEYIRTLVEPTHFHVARLMKKLYEGNYVASINSKATEWFYYDDAVNMWKHLNQGIQLRKNISFEVASYISQAKDKLRSAPTYDEDSESLKKKKLEKLLKVETNLYTTGFVDSTMKMAANFFYVEDFQNKLDTNVFLFGCRNGILELRAKTPDNPREHVIFRQGRPEDYVSFLAGQNLPDMEAINYIPFAELNSEQKTHLAGLKDFFDKVFPDPALCGYVLRLIASCLEGANREQCYYTMIGKGSNGKSKINDLCRFVFGDYWCSLQTTALTRKRPDAGNANPEIMAVKNKRFISMNEPDKGEPINTSRMKQFSGEDMVEARGLFMDQEKFRITGKLFMLTNSLPPINTMDYGTWRRIRAIPFEATFPADDDPRLKSGKPLPPKVHRRDPEMESKLILWREVFLSWIVHIYDTEYIPKGLNPVPECVLEATAQYKQDFDTFAKFRAERMRNVEGEKTCFKQISSAYTKWLADGSKRGSRMTPRELQDRLEDELGKPEDGKTFNHILVFNDEIDVEEWDQSQA
jgi:P4 family phage/plasmid primase-like protien